MFAVIISHFHTHHSTARDHNIGNSRRRLTPLASIQHPGECNAAFSFLIWRTNTALFQRRQIDHPMSSVLCPPAEFSGALSGSFVEVDPRRPDNTPEFTVMPFPPRDLGPCQRYFHQPAQNCHMRVSAVMGCAACGFLLVFCIPSWLHWCSWVISHPLGSQARDLNGDSVLFWHCL